MSNLYSFTNNKCENAGAPMLTPAGGFTASFNGSNYIGRDSLNFSSGFIDVVNNFQWTHSPPGTQSRQEVPGITLREKRLRTNSLIAGAAYFLSSASSSLGTLDARIGSVFGQSIGGVLSNIASNPGLQSTFSTIGNIFNQNLLNSVATLTTGNSDINSILGATIEGLNSKYLRPYEGLYITEDTKFTYYLPYFADQLNNVLNRFTENDQQLSNSIMGQGVNEIYNAASALARFAHFKEPGIYIERPKFYNFTNTGESIELEFPLVNTGWATYDDVRRNWQLCFMLTYQNRPNRRSRELIDPACIYEVNIPGVKYMPYAFISQLKIDFMGSRRMMPLEVPGGTINTIVPDAYKIYMLIEGLLPESQNFLASMLSDKQDIVNVVSNDRYNPFGEIFNSYENSFRNESASLRTQ